MTFFDAWYRLGKRSDFSQALHDQHVIVTAGSSGAAIYQGHSTNGEFPYPGTLRSEMGDAGTSSPTGLTSRGISAATYLLTF